MLDYLETGLFRGRPDAASPPGHRRAPAPDPVTSRYGRPRSPGGAASGVRRLLADGRVLAGAAVVAVALAVLAGISVPLHSTQAGPARPGATMAPPSPGMPAAPSPARPAATPSASLPARSTASPGAAGASGPAPGRADGHGRDDGPRHPGGQRAGDPPRRPGGRRDGGRGHVHRH
jgi:hypothetical protein